MTRQSPAPTAQRPEPIVLALLLVVVLPRLASAQIVESVGSRALGMGGAFVAVANDSSATWWNPAGLAAGPFFDLTLGHGLTQITDTLPARRERTTWFAAATLPLGVSYYRLNITDIGRIRPIAPEPGGREDRRAAVPQRSVSASQLGGTLVHTLVSGVHVAATLKYVRVSGLPGEVTGTESATVADWFDLADEVDRGDSRGTGDLDVGVLAVRGPVKLGAVMRNLREPELGEVTIPRQVRMGVAVDAASSGPATLTVAADADVRAYATPYGDRRVVAVGGEGWFRERRFGFRAGSRFNTIGEEERAFTAGGSVAVRAGMFVEGHVVYGGRQEEGGWGIAVRASF